MALPRSPLDAYRLYAPACCLIFSFSSSWGYTIASFHRELLASFLSPIARQSRPDNCLYFFVTPKPFTNCGGNPVLSFALLP